MKKYLGFIIAGIVAVILPMSASAGIEGVCNKSTTCKQDEKCTSTCTVKITGNNKTLSSFDGSFEIKGEGATVTSIQPGEGWQLVSPTDVSQITSKTVPVSFISESGVSASNFLLMTVTLELEDTATECAIRMTSAEQGTVEIKVEQTVQTKTGAELPIAIVGVGACAAIVIYISTKKTKKIYKI